LSGRHSQTILGPAGVVQDMRPDNTDKGREAFSKIKNILRKVGACTHEALLEAMAEALSAVTPRDAAGWFDHCGYEVEVQYL
jgi:hypothetical protein